ncbi:RcpC/CpaB family pilus assembly protein [Actinotalea sp. K2]|uniref:RcpC/CpaB family pilus assembly protein n=1 Tax=Actinotalea sp. K2 TaxID=2939438 RepID=UPI0020171B25|nr:RcpC/CpaB family pilus assembly protein [Actinotalea sp. K2]MCL3861252.1 RcpC/CpaB family pilus assembly protein [Actinotalea sp. K2]
MTPAAAHPHRWLRWRVLAWRTRPLQVLLGLAVAGAVVLHQLAPPAPSTTAVVVAARDLAAGTDLARADLRTVHLPDGVVPDGAARRTEDLTGRRTVVPLTRGLPVVDSLLAGSRFGLDQPPGTVVVPLRLADAAVAALLRPGDRVDLVTPVATTGADGDSTGAEVVAHRALVLDVSRPATGPVSMLGTPGEDDASVTVVAVAPEEGARLAALTGWSTVNAVLVG